MPTIIGCGTFTIDTNGKSWGQTQIPVQNMQVGDQVLLTPSCTNGGETPIEKGPLYCAFISAKASGTFDCLVFDINGNDHDVVVPVDWMVIRPT